MAKREGSSSEAVRAHLLCSGFVNAERALENFEKTFRVSVLALMTRGVWRKGEKQGKGGQQRVREEATDATQVLTAMAVTQREAVVRKEEKDASSKNFRDVLGARGTSAGCCERRRGNRAEL